jgi:hypothetical protein
MIIHASIPFSVPAKHWAWNGWFSLVVKSVIENVVAKSNGSDPHVLKFFQPHFRKNFGRNAFSEIVAVQFNPGKLSL